MIMEMVRELGSWNWWVLGLILLGLEIVMPGTFFLWFGLSAMIVGAVSLVLGPENSVWVWQAQVVVFVALSLVTAFFGRRIIAQYGWDKSENEDLNDRGGQLIGQKATLTEAIVNGSGRVKFGDTTWRVKGPNLEPGTTVEIVGREAGTLIVREA